MGRSLVTGENQRSASTHVEQRQRHQVGRNTAGVIPNLNINRIRDANADGFNGAACDFCAVMEYPLRLGFQPTQNERIVQSLALNDKDQGRTLGNAGHLKALKSTGLLIESYKNLTPPNGRLDIKSNTSTFRDVFPARSQNSEALP